MPKKEFGKKTIKEILQQPDSWETVLADKYVYQKKVEQLKKLNIENVVFIGCGSSYYISQAGSFVFSKITGVASRALPASEIIFNSEVYLDKNKKHLVVAISRSGETTEVIKAINKIYNHENVVTLGLTCYEESTLARKCAHTLLSKDGQEESVVMTKSFSSLLLGTELFSALWGENQQFIDELNQIPRCFRENIEGWEEKIKLFATSNNFESYEFMGHGNFYGLACEATLKMKEMAIIPTSQNFYSLEFRHGPKSVADNRMLVSIYIGENTYKYEKKLCKELLDYGVNLFVICNRADKEVKEFAHLLIELGTDLSQLALTPLALLPNQLFAYYTTVKKGLNPDNPRNLTQYVKNI